MAYDLLTRSQKKNTFMTSCNIDIVSILQGKIFVPFLHFTFENYKKIFNTKNETNKLLNSHKDILINTSATNLDKKE